METGEESQKWERMTVTTYLCFCLCLHYCARVSVCVCRITSPGIVIIGHSVCGLDRGEVRLQGKQLTGQGWHTAEMKTGKFAAFLCNQKRLFTEIAKQ